MATMTGRVRAPELRGAGGWANTDRELSLADLRGRVVLLDFWTFCCVNCLRVIEELRPLEERFGDRLVVIGVHSPKFPHEGDHESVLRAVQRHRIHHPVLDDPDMEMWQRYGVRAWPTLVVIDQDGYVVGTASGEGNAAALAEVIEGLLQGREAPSTAAFRPVVLAAGGELAFPGKVACDGAARLAIADTGHDRVLLSDLAGTVLAVYEGFEQPQGVRFDRDRLLVCDTVGGRVVSLDLDSGHQTVLASGLHSPWDAVVAPGGAIVVAEAGLHRLVGIGAGGAVDTVAGTRAEGLRDGPAAQAHLAQPSGLAVLRDGSIAIADSEVSALRELREGRVTTLVGRGLFEWGEADGAEEARLQHPLGVAALAGGGIAIADTFNSKLRIWRDGELSTVRLSEPLDEPGGLDALPDGRLVVADTNHHRVVLVDLRTGAVEALRLTTPASAPPIQGASGERVAVTIALEGIAEDLDASGGPPVRVTMSAEPETLISPAPRTWALDALPGSVDLRLGTAGHGVLTVDISAATCSGDVCTIVHRSSRHPLHVS